jgi:hypothetical protein
MRTLVLAFALALPVAAVADVIPRPPRIESERRATDVAKELWNALGGDDGWNHARYLRFDWIVERGGKRVVARSHYWDRFTGRYRVDGVDEKAGPYSVYLNVNTRSGDAWVGGKKLTDAAEIKKWVNDGYEAFINDSYWLLAPFKLLDPGVTLAYDGEDKGPGGEACDVVKLSFAGVGLTPKDIYWMLVDQKSHLVVEWKYILDGGKGPPTAFAWSDWHKVGSIQLASTRTGLGKPSVIRFDKLAVSEKPDDAALTPPSK